MRAEYFLDTNILLYAMLSDPDEAAKRVVARGIMAKDNWGVSVQVLQEFYVNAVRSKGQKSKPTPTAAMTFEQAGLAVRQFLAYPVVANSAALMLLALELHHTHQTSYWDAAILAAAHELGAKTAYSEDLNHGQRYGEVTVINPFRG